MISRIKYVIIVLLTIALMPISVLASPSITLDVDKNELTIGDEIVVSAKTSDDLNPYALIATLKYDQNVFEKLDEDDFTIDNMSSISYNAENNKFGIINRKTSDYQEEILFNVHLKVKENASVGDTNIALTNISSSNGNGKEDIPTTSVKVLVTRDAKDGESIPLNKENDVSEDNESILKVFSTVPFQITILVAAIGLLIYICVYRLKNKNITKLFIASLALDIVLFATVCLLFISNYSKKDVNKDGKKDYSDAEEVIRYLIDIENVEEKEEDQPTEEKKHPQGNNSGSNNNSNKNEVKDPVKEDNDTSNTEDKPSSSTPKPDNKPDDNFDTNNDGKVDVDDVGHIVDDVNKNIKVKLEELNEDNEYYVTKEEILFRLKATITPAEVKITKIKVNDKYYDATLNDDIYEVLVSSETPGVQDFKITEVLTDNGENVATSLKITREVLKDTPYVNKFNLDDKEGYLSFELVDPDKAFIKGKVTIYDGEKEIISQEVSKMNVIEDIPVVEDKEYTLNIIGEYDLDSKENDQNNHYTDKVMFSHTFVTGGHYNFALNSLTITDELQPEEIPVITFKSTNNYNADIKNANISNDKNNPVSYEPTKVKDNTYEIILSEASLTPGKHTISLDSVKLDTLKTFENVTDYRVNTLTYTVLKEAPKAEKITLNNNKEEKAVDVSFDINDPSKSITKLNVVLVDSMEKIVSIETIPVEDISTHHKLSLHYGNNTDGLYKVKILADYSLSDKYIYTNKSIGEEQILTHKDDIYIEKIFITNNQNNDTGNLYPTKNQSNYQVGFIVHISNSIFELSKAKYSGRQYGSISMITINGLNYPASAISADKDKPNEYKAKVYLNVPEDAGVLSLKTTRVQLAINSYYWIVNDFFSVEEKTLDIDVLKDKPTITNLIVKNEDYENGKVTFDFDVKLDPTAKDNDNSFSEGTIELGSETKPITRGHNSITFDNVSKDKDLDLIIKAKYDLDSNTIPDENKNEYNSELYHVKYGLYEDTTYKDIAITDGSAISKKGNNYFEKNEDIKLRFNITNLPPDLTLNPRSIVIEDEEYALTKTETGYEIILNGYHSSGIKELTPTAITFDNGKKVTLTNTYTFKPEVLKDIVKINDYKYTVDEDIIKVTFTKKDPDSSLADNAKVIVKDELGKVILNTDYSDVISFTKEDGIIRYNIEVIADYDRDVDRTPNSENYYANVTLLNETISFDQNSIELKDIKDINLYKKTKVDGKEVITLIDEVSLEELEADLDSYFVEIIMNNLPATRVKILKALEENNHLYLVLNYEYVTSESKSIRIDFGEIQENGKAINEEHPNNAFTKLLTQLKNNENITLNQNYDASSITIEDDFYVESYSGTLNGNGYVIRNLSRPLFGTLEGATIKNLTVENITLPSKNARGVLANTAKNSNINTVFVNNLTKSGSEAVVGALVGTIEKTTIENSRANSFTLNISGNTQQIGGLIGSANSSTIRNCYVEGTISGGWNYRGALVANANSSTIENNYTKVILKNGVEGTKMSGGILYSVNGKNTIKNNISLSQGVDQGISNDSSNRENNYFVNYNNVKEETGTKAIKIEDINSDFFINTLHFDDTIWDLRSVSADNLPKFIVETKTKLEMINDFDANKEILYKNLMKLNPYFNDSKIIEMGKNVDTDNILNKKEIKHIAPVSRDGSLVTYLTSDNVKKITKIKVVFEDGYKTEYAVSYDKNYDMVAAYRIPSLKIDYTYSNYIIDVNSQLVNNLTNYLLKLDYATNLDILTTNEDSRIYRDFYNDVTRNELQEFVLKFLSNSNYTNTSTNENINDYLEREIKKDQKLEKVLYTYNYLRRFYDVEIDNMKLYDFVLFNMKGFDKSLTPIEIANLFFSNSTGVYFNTDNTYSAYNTVLSKYTKLPKLTDFLEYMVTKFSDETDMAKWVKKEFKGILVELPIDGQPDITYTLWDHFKGSADNSKVVKFILPILTLPKTAAYIISSPVQFIIGSQRTYMANPDNPEELEAFMTKLETYTTRMKSYYTTTYDIIKDKDIFNNLHLFHLDKRNTKNPDGTGSYNTPNSTEELFHKNFNDVVKLWPAAAAVNAAAWGDYIEWQVAGVLDSTLTTDGSLDVGHVTFKTFTHESAHNLDSKLFLKGNGRRFNAGGEDYADAFLMQSFEKFGIVMNLSINFDLNKLNEKGEAVGSNLTPARIDSEDKIFDFYNKAFDTIYTIDYLEAKAFLKLNDEEQGKLAVQVSYPNADTLVEFKDSKGNTYTEYKDAEGNTKQLESKAYKDDPYAQNIAYQTTQYTKLNLVTDFDYSKLNTIDDLVDNKIMLYPGVEEKTSIGPGRYGGEGYNVAHWYQPNNIYGFPNSYSFKYFSYEMLGYAGYTNGFIEYASNIHAESRTLYSSLSATINQNKAEDGTTYGTLALTEVNNYKSDLMALKRITGDKYNSFEEYKKARFNEIAQKLDRLNNVINAEEYVDKFYRALQADINDKDLKNSSEVRFQIYNTLKNSTNDFTGDVYKTTHQQDVSKIIK